MNRIIFIFFVFFHHVLGQSDTIIFAGSSTTQAPTSSGQSQCICLPTGTCPTPAPGGIDIRIVNTGVTCPAGQQACCNSGSSGNINDGTCGIRKITPTMQPVMGQASFGAYPWQAAILTPSNNYIGSGVLIDATHVLTAAHKVINYSPAGLKVRLGEWNAQAVNEPNPYQDFTVTRISTHPNYNAQNLQNDVAVLTLSAAVPIASSPNINTACLPTSTPAAGTRCWTSGWGKNAFGASGSYQSILKEVDVPIVSQADCQARLRNTRLGQFFILDTNSFICAGGEPGKDACTGDGGSPLVCQSASGQWVVYGMVAWGIGCADPQVPGVYINIFNYLSWINQQRS